MTSCVARIRHASVFSSPAVDGHILAHLGDHLREMYADLVEENLPRGLLGLLKRLCQVIRAHEEPPDQAFINDLMAALPELRRYAIALEKDPIRADDLVQETVLKALSQHERFETGTCLRSWLFTIQKNHFLTTVRRRVREVEDATGAFAAALITEPDQQDKITHQELLAALDRLDEDQREVLMLVAVEGLSYDDAALRMGCAVGTIKSRVNRARKHLAEQMGLTPADVVGWTRI
jgi:RNA polymerase sigma-70 factor (ECF subfamily)